MMAEKNNTIENFTFALAQLSEDDKIRMRCEARKDHLAIENGLYSRGMKAGLEQGEELGRKKGAHQARISLAKKLLSQYDDQAISELTELPIETIQQLRDKQ